MLSVGGATTHKRKSLAFFIAFLFLSLRDALSSCSSCAVFGGTTHITSLEGGVEEVVSSGVGLYSSSVSL